MGSIKYVIFDLDGTLADATHRLHFIQREEKDWDGFFGACVDDKPIHNNIDISQALYENYKIIIITGRSSAVWDETITWLREHDVAYQRLLMRNKGDRTPDHRLKVQMAKDYGLTPENTLCVFDDRSVVVDAWRDVGFNCHQVAQGDF